MLGPLNTECLSVDDKALYVAIKNALTSWVLHWSSHIPDSEINVCARYLALEVADELNGVDR